MSERGYTLLELLVVLAIIGLVCVMVLPLVSGPTERMRTEAAARTVAEKLRALRQKAVNEGVEQRFSSATIAKGIALTIRGRLGNEIDFYPDGSTSGGTVRVDGAGTRHVVVVRWPSAQIAVDE